MENVSEKNVILGNIKEGLASGIISVQDLRNLLPPEISITEPAEPAEPVETPVSQVLQPTPVQEETARPRAETGKKLSLVDTLFYLAGGVLYASLMVMAFQAGADSRAAIMLVCGVTLWALTFVLGRRQSSSENREGFVNAMLLTGCLAVISGGVMAASQVAQDLNIQFGYVLAVALLLLGGMHLYLDRLFRHTILVVFGMFLVVAAFPSILSAMLSGQNLPMDVWTLIGMGTGALTAAAGYVASHTAPGREHLRDSFSSIAAFFVLSSVYGASIGSEAAALWSIVLPLLIYGAFYLSIKRRSKNFLVTGSLFLVLFIITIAFRYFSGFGAAFSLLVSATALLATAFMASSINKRYIKSSAQE